MKILFISYSAVSLCNGQVRTVAMLQALADAGHRIDLLAPGCDLPPHAHIRVLLDETPHKPIRWRMRLAALRAVGRETYEAVHAVDDAVFFSYRLSRWKRIPFAYDAVRRFTGASGSGIPRRYRLFPSYARRIEASILERAACVFSPCSALSGDLAGLNRQARIVQLEDIPIQPLFASREADKASLLKRFGMHPLSVVFFCSLPDGSIRLRHLLMAARKVVETAPNTAFFFKGFPPAPARKMAANLDIADHCVFLLSEEVKECLDALDSSDVVLLVPQTQGRYILPQVYTVLNGPAPVVATHAPAYDEVLTEATCVQVLPSPEGMAEGILRMIQEPLFAMGIANEAKQRITSGNSYSSFKHKVRMTYYELSRKE